MLNIYFNIFLQVIQNFDQLNSKELVESFTMSKRQDFSAKNLSEIVDKIVDHIFDKLNKGIKPTKRNRHIFDYLNNQNITLQEIINWLLNNQNNSNAIFLFGYFNFFGIDVNKNYETAFNLFIKLSEQHTKTKWCILAQFYIGKCYKEGYGIDQDINEAIHWYEQSARQGYQSAQYNLAIIYKNRKDRDKAIYWYKKSAEQGDREAQFNLARIYKKRRRRWRWNR